MNSLIIWSSLWLITVGYYILKARGVSKDTLRILRVMNLIFLIFVIIICI